MSVPDDFDPPPEPEYRQWLVEVLLTFGEGEFDGAMADTLGNPFARRSYEAHLCGHILWNQTRRKYKLSAAGLRYLKNDDSMERPDDTKIR